MEINNAFPARCRFQELQHGRLLLPRDVAVGQGIFLQMKNHTVILTLAKTSPLS